MPVRRTLGYVSGMALCALCAFGGLGAFGACAQPTQITVSVTTDVACDAKPVTRVTGGHGDGTTDACTPRGDLADIGSIVLVPSRAKDDSVSLTVVTGVGKAPSDCDTTKADPQCIVARRKMRFIPRTPLAITVQMRAACLGKLCPDGQTCVLGTCKTADVADPTFGDEGDAGSTFDAAPLADAAGDTGNVPDGAPLDGSADAPTDATSFDAGDSGPLAPCVAPGPPVLWAVNGLAGPPQVPPFGLALTKSYVVWIDASLSRAVRATDRLTANTLPSGMPNAIRVGAHEDVGTLYVFAAQGSVTTSSLFYGAFGNEQLLVGSQPIVALSVSGAGAAAASFSSGVAALDSVHFWYRSASFPAVPVGEPGAVAVENSQAALVAVPGGIDSVSAGTVTSIRTTSLLVTAIALDPATPQTGLFWVETDTVASTATLYSGTRTAPNSSPFPVASALKISAIAANQSKVYWITDTAVASRAPGTALPSRFPLPTPPTAIVADDTCVYIGTPGGIYRWAPP